MSSINVTIGGSKASFFDRERIERAVDAGTRRVLSRFGAFVRQRAKTSIKKKRGTSPPGSPPYAHVYVNRKANNPNGKARKGSKFYLLPNSIFFSHDASKKTVVIGPTLLNGSRRSPTVPELLEQGGTITRGGKSLRYRARPFMRPAFKAEIAGRLADQLKDFARAA